MKTWPLMFLVLLPLTVFAGAVKNGDRIDTVLTALGGPRGRAQIGSRELLCFDRGEVELISGVVTRVALRSAEAQAAFETKRTAEALRLREEQEIRLDRLTAEGEALKISKLADKLFQSAPAREQVEFWRNFASRYSAVPCTEQLYLARARLYEQEQAEESRRLAELETNESSAKTVYPFHSAYYSDYDLPYREQRRQDRLDREYYERVHGSSHRRTDVTCRDERAQNFSQRHQARKRDHDSSPDRRFEKVVMNRGSTGGSRNNTATNNSLLAVGQNVMAWDGMKMPGGEAAGLYR